MLLLAIRVGIGVIRKLERPLELLRTTTALWAGDVRQEKKVPVHLDLFLTCEQFEEVMSNPTVWQAYREARLLKFGGVLPQCPNCKTLHIPH